MYQHPMPGQKRLLRHVCVPHNVVALSLTTALLGACGGDEGNLTDGSSGTSDAATADPIPSTSDATTTEPGTETTQSSTDGTPSTTDPGTTDEGTETSDTTGEPPPELAVVGHEREFRGAWVATVYNINFPSAAGLTRSELETEITQMLDTLQSLHFNAIVFQVRPESDALYASAIEPWSRFLSGTQGVPPPDGFDPLAFVTEQAHQRQIEVHAWFNPYRAKVNSQVAADPAHISELLPQAALPYGNLLWMDPGSEDVRGWFVDVIADVVSNYDLDGVHFDDYFYPYPDGSPFPDDATWASYQQNGGTLSRGDWRRDNVNQLVEDVSTTISSLRPDVRFGISPFGIYRPGMPEGITGLDQYAELFSDPPVWMQHGWVDYLAPQLYWPSTQTAQAYGPLVAWWSELTAGGQGYIFAGNYLAQVGSEAKWSVDEFLIEIDLSRQQRPNGSLGNIFYHIDPLMTDHHGVATALVESAYPTAVLTPVLAAFQDASIPYPEVQVIDGDVVLAPPEGLSGADLRAYTIYTFTEGEWRLHAIVSGSAQMTSLPAGEYAIAAVDRRGVESPGVVIAL